MCYAIMKNDFHKIYTYYLPYGRIFNMIQYFSNHIKIKARVSVN